MNECVDFLVIGCGVVGVNQAHALWERGFKVRVLDAAVGAACETSYANAGQLSFAYSGPWATPDITSKKVLRMLYDVNGPLRVWPDLSSLINLYRQIQFLYRFSLNTSIPRFKQNKRRILALSRLSAQCLKVLLNEAPVQFDHRQEGTLQLFRSDQRLFDGVLKNDLDSLKEAGVSVDVLDADGCIQQESALSAIRDQIIGGLWFKDDETGDCHQLTSQLYERLAAKGVEFRFNTRVAAIEVGKIAYGVRTEANEFFRAKHIVLCTGPFTRRLTDPIGLNVPVYPVRGYALTAGIADQSRAVRSTVLDEKTKIAITRLGDRVRLGGTAEIAGFGKKICVRRTQVLMRTLDAVFPGSANLNGSDVEPWLGLRPMTPDGTPIIGRTAIPNLFLNLGHGTLGFTQAAGSAQLLAQIMCGETPALDPADYELGRYGRRIQAWSLYEPVMPPIPA